MAFMVLLRLFATQSSAVADLLPSEEGSQCVGSNKRLRR